MFIVPVVVRCLQYTSYVFVVYNMQNTYLLFAICQISVCCLQWTRYAYIGYDIANTSTYIYWLQKYVSVVYTRAPRKCLLFILSFIVHCAKLLSFYCCIGKYIVCLLFRFWLHAITEEIVTFETKITYLS